MARIPAICEKCNTIFRSGIDLGNGSITTSFTNCGAGPCPKCGGKGRILDGVYTAVGGAIEAFVGPQDFSVLKKLSVILETAKKEGSTRDKVISEIKETCPSFSKWSGFLPHDRTELYAFCMLVIMFIDTLLGLGKTDLNKNELTQQLEVTINNYYEGSAKRQPTSKSSLPIKSISADYNQIGRNEPCPCGSGKKYKKCCGK
jgi:hypothetical protein